MSEPTGVIGLARPLEGPKEIDQALDTSPIGVFIAFVTQDDAHSPLMTSVYAELFEHMERQIPLIFVDCRDPSNEDLMEKCLIYSVPTLVWARKIDGNFSVQLRQIGTVLFLKLKREVEEQIEKVLA